MAKSTKISKTGLSAMTSASPTHSKVWTDIMSQNTRFVSALLQEYLEAQKAMLACKNPSEVVQIQSMFFQIAFEQYTTEALKMFDIMTGATEETIKNTKTRYKRDYDDVPV